ncbi:response regulator ArlR [Staphylococcus gallinarum]|uniref:Response regulator ArlR n=1 Tax=Staphylococcus gallinarum TaxID=1293 RepID=A0A380FHZ0_STAGA|nr:response regulator ArlR [Staphylococcus gallinarum]
MTKILIVEDEQNLARFIELELEHENYTVDIENDGKIRSRKGINKQL